MWPRVVTDGPPHHEAWGGTCVLWVNALQKMTFARSTLYLCMPIQTEPTLITEDNRMPFHSPVDLLQHQSSHAWWCRGVSGSLARGTHDLTPAASRQFPVVLGDTAGATCARVFFFWMLFVWPQLLKQCIVLDVCLYYVAIQDLVYGCGNVPQITAGSSDTPLIHCAQHM